MEGSVDIFIKSEEFFVSGIKKLSDSNGILIHVTSGGNGLHSKIAFDCDYYIPYSNISWIKFNSGRANDDKYIND